MNLIEKKYNEAIDQMTGKQKIERMASLHTSICEMLALQLTSEVGALGDRMLRIKIAKKLYLTDVKTLTLLNKINELK